MLDHPGKLANRFPFIEKFCGDGAYQGIEKARPRPMEIVKRHQAGFRRPARKAIYKAASTGAPVKLAASGGLDAFRGPPATI